MFSPTSEGRSRSSSPSWEFIRIPLGALGASSDSATGHPLESYRWNLTRRRPSVSAAIFRITSPVGPSRKEIDVPGRRCPSLVSSSCASRWGYSSDTRSQCLRRGLRPPRPPCRLPPDEACSTTTSMARPLSSVPFKASMAVVAASSSSSTRAKPRARPARSRATRNEPISPKGEKMARKSLAVASGDRLPTYRVVKYLPRSRISRGPCYACCCAPGSEAQQDRVFSLGSSSDRGSAHAGRSNRGSKPGGLLAARTVPRRSSRTERRPRNTSVAQMSRSFRGYRPAPICGKPDRRNNAWARS